MICTMSAPRWPRVAPTRSSTTSAVTWLEATGANIFFVKDGEVHTPNPDCILNGITRQTVIGMLKDMQIKVHERYIKPEELATFEQCWLTGTAAEVTPVGQIGDYMFERWATLPSVATGLTKACPLVICAGGDQSPWSPASIYGIRYTLP